MTDEPTFETCLLLSTETQHFGERPTLQLWATPVKVATDGEVFNYVESSYDPAPLADLRVRAQHDYAAEPYAWRVEYHSPYAVDLRRAQEMAKMLRKVERGLERVRLEYGYPESFPAYVARVGKILGIKRYGWRHPDGGIFPTGERYRWTDVDGMTSHVHTLVRDFGKG